MITAWLVWRFFFIFYVFLLGSFGLVLYGIFFAWIEPIISYLLCFSLLFLYVVGISGLLPMEVSVIKGSLFSLSAHVSYGVAVMASTDFLIFLLSFSGVLFDIHFYLGANVRTGHFSLNMNYYSRLQLYL